VRKGSWIVVAFLGLALGFSACRGEPVVTAPSGSSRAPAAPAGSQPQIRAIIPTVSTTLGNGWGTISGSGFERGAQLWLGSAAPTHIFVENAQTIRFDGTSPHEAGAVDVIVRNPGGRLDRLALGFTFALPESFDFNGSWVAHAGDEYDTDMQFVIDHNRLTSLTCGSSPAIAFAAPPAVSGGEFSFVGEDGLRVFGRIVSNINAVGEINIPPCAPTWWADKSTATQLAR
jgi:hypothetical protein